MARVVKTQAAENRVAILRRTIADLEAREAALLADIATLEVAIAAMRRWVDVHDAARQRPSTRGEIPCAVVSC